MDRLLVTAVVALVLASSGACHKAAPAAADKGTTTVQGALLPEPQVPPSARAAFFAPSGMAGESVDVRVGNDFVTFQHLLVADTLNSTIRRVEASTGLVTTLLGSPGVEGSTSTLFKRPAAVAVSGYPGRYYVADTGNNTIRTCCSDETGAPGSPTIAGVPGQAGYAEGSPGVFNQPSGIAVDITDSGYAGVVTAVFVADTGNSVIRSVTWVEQYDENTGELTVTYQTALIAGIPGQPGFADAATGTAAKFNRPTGLAYDRFTHKLYVADTGNHIIRVVNLAAGAGNAVTTLAGSPGQYGHHDGLLTAEALFAQPVSVTLSLEQQIGQWVLMVSDRASYTVRRIELAPGIAQPRVTTVAGVAWERGFVDGNAATARLRAPSGVAVVAGKTYVLDTGNNLVRAIRPDGQGVFVSTLTGSRKPGSSDGWPGTLSIGNPRTIACDGTRLFADGIGVNIIDLDPDGAGGAARTVASADWTGFTYFAGYLHRPLAYSIETLNIQTGEHATYTSVFNTNEDGNTFVLAAGTTLFSQFASFDMNNAQVLIRWANPPEYFFDPVLDTAPAWDGTHLYSYAPGPREIVRLDPSTVPFGRTAIAVPGLGSDQIASMAVANGSAYITTTGRHDVRRIDLATGAVTTLAGSATTADAPFENPNGLCISGGNLFVADTGNGAVRKVDLATGTTVALALRRAQ